MEALFSYLIHHDRLSSSLLSRAEGALAPRKLRNSKLRKLLRRSPAPARDLARSVLACVRGGQSDEDLWITWRWAVRDPGVSLWLKDLNLRPELNGTLASMAGFDSEAARIRVRLSSGETLVLPGRNLSWAPPDPADVDTISLLLSKVIDPEAAGKVCGQLECTRCERPCESDTRCVVLHNACSATRIDLVGKDGKFGDRAYYLCGACGGLLWKDDGTTTVASSGNCWEGKHTTVELVIQDRRVTTWHHATLFMDDHTQQAIAEIPDSASSLLFYGEFGPFGYEFDEELFGEEAIGFKEYMEDRQVAEQIKIDRSFPNLKLLQFWSHPTAELVINDELMPELRMLSLKAMPGLATYYINSSRLKILCVELCFGGESVIEDIVQGATALEELQASGPKIDELYIASNSLKVIDLSDAEEHLERLSLWAPNLEVLVVRSSQIEELHWLENHPLESDLPTDHLRPALRVRNGKSNVKEGWLDHPKVTYFDGPIDVDEVLPAVHQENLLKRFGLEPYGEGFGARTYGGIV